MLHETRRPVPLRQRVASTWQAVRWPLLAALALASFVLGFVGFREYFETTGADRTNLDVVYLTIQLYTLESGSVPQAGAPWELEVARLLAPGFSAAALLTAFAVAFRQQLEDWKLRRSRSHVIVCGLGSRGAPLAVHLLDAGRRIVAIEADVTNSSLASLRRRGAAVVVGDACDPDTLWRARPDRATHLICVAGNDDTNAEIVLGAADLVADRRGPALACLANIRDPDLCVAMRSEELNRERRSGTRLDFFHLDEQGARAMLRDHPPFGEDDPAQIVPHAVVVGTNRFAQSLTTELARRWRSHPAEAAARCTIRLVGPDADRVVGRLRRRYPQLDRTADVVPVVADLDPLDVAQLAPEPAGATTYVCVEEASAGLKAALALRRHLVEPAAIVVEVRRAAGIAGLVEHAGRDDRIHVFSVVDRAMGVELLLGGVTEVLARAIHDEYLRTQRAGGATRATNPSLVPWDELPETLRESNRDQAAHIGTKLAAIGRSIAPLADWDAERLTFTDAEVERLAEMEHDRWMAQRRADGWTPGPKDVEGRTTPYLVPWDELTEEVKELDRQAVRGIPGFLARAGYQVVAP